MTIPLSSDIKCYPVIVTLRYKLPFQSDRFTNSGDKYPEAEMKRKQAFTLIKSQTLNEGTEVNYIMVQARSLG